MSINEVIANPRVRQWLPGILNAGMLLLLTYSLAQWTWLLAKPSLPPVVIAPPPTAAEKGSFSVQSLIASHLFGRASEELADGRLVNLPVSSMNLVLTGAIPSGSGGYALISVNGQAEEPFSVGQFITGGAVLHAVYPDRVVIRRHGVLESLLLAGVENDPQAPSAFNRMANQGAARPQNGFIQETAPNQYVVERDMLAAQMRNPDFLKQATMLPHKDGGFLVRQIQPGSLYEKLGMQTGDIIRNINGQPVNSAEDAIRLYTQLTTVASVQIEIVRGGRTESLFYQFSQN